MRIKYLAHSCFLITGGDGVRILIDPYRPGGYDGALAYGPIADVADVVVVTHEHSDHNAVEEVPDHPLIVRRSATARGIDFEAYCASHDKSEGSQRGLVNLFAFEIEGIRVAHLSDLGHLLSDEQVEELGRVDVLFLPVGGRYTIDASEAKQVMSRIRPSLAIPMHFKTDQIGFSLDPVNRFLDLVPEARRPGRSLVEIRPNSLPKPIQVVVLEPAN